MVLKLNISDSGKAWKLELESSGLIGKAIGDRIDGRDIGSDFEGYELEIRGGSDKSGFPLSKDIEGIGLKRVLLTRGWGMRDSRKGIRKRKSVRGKQISETTVQINLNVAKVGKKSLAEIFPDQNKKKVEEKVEEKAEEKKEEIKEEEKAEERQDKEEEKQEVKEEKTEGEEKGEGK